MDKISPEQRQLSPAEIDRRVMASRRALRAWSRKGDEIALAQISAELGVLESLAARARELGRPEKALKIEALVARYR